ncbi:hypothetical protein X767_32935 [Mesorhizobium sp. LSJC264A00]|nr:hypothetical protein X767_32935 [Mesorhizobium sp. LSJC264A00]
MQEKPKPVYAEPGQARVQALRMVWPIVSRRLEEFPNINATQLFEELCVQFPGRFTRKQYKTLVRRINLWRQAARARGVVVGPKTYRRLNDKPRGRRPDIFKDHWEEMARCLEERPDQTALELLVEFQVRYPGRYSLRQLHTLQKRVRAWRQQAVQRLIGGQQPSAIPRFRFHTSGERVTFLVRQHDRWSPKKSVLHKTISAIRAPTWEEINKVLLASARREKLESGGKVVRVDSTVTAALVHEPSDSSLLWDAVRVMVRLLQHADALGSAIPWHDHCRAAKKRSRAIEYSKTLCPCWLPAVRWFALHWAVLKRGLLVEPILMPGGRTMEEYSEVFVGLDVSKDRHAVALAESGRERQRQDTANIVV